MRASRRLICVKRSVAKTARVASGAASDYLVSAGPEAERELDVVELDSAGAVGAEKHSQRQEGHEHGNSRASRAERDEYARGQHRPDEEKRNAFVHVDILAARDRERSPRAGSRWRSRGRSRA